MCARSKNFPKRECKTPEAIWANICKARGIERCTIPERVLTETASGGQQIHSDDTPSGTITSSRNRGDVCGEVESPLC